MPEMHPPKQRPVFLLVTPKTGEGLHRLKKELQKIQEIFRPFEKHLHVETLTLATVESIGRVFRDYQNRIVGLHFAGHAAEDRLMFDSPDEEGRPAFGKALVSFLQEQPGLQLVFLNACSTLAMARALVSGENPPAVAIGTTRKVEEERAFRMAVQFYAHFAKDDSFVRAWRKATSLMEADTAPPGTDRAARRSRRADRKRTAQPWQTCYASPESSGRNLTLWKLLGDPLVGLELPDQYYKKLPLEPYKSIHYFTEADAVIFFGRGEQIRQLYDKLSAPESHEKPSDSEPLILLHGQSGVGKSSLLDAGFLPRVRRYYQVAYRRRPEEGGLPAALSAALTEAAQKAKVTGRASHDVVQLKAEIAEMEGELQNITNPEIRKFTEQLLTVKKQQLDLRNDPRALWLAIEAADPQRPLLIILDQAEELFTKQKSGSDEQELSQFIHLLRHIFYQDKTPAPAGKLILSMRTEYHGRFYNKLTDRENAAIGTRDMLIEPLKRQQIEAVVNGIPADPRLKVALADLDPDDPRRINYRVEIPGEDRGLAEEIAGDLLKDERSHIAPLLQILLYRMWEAQKAFLKEKKIKKKKLELTVADYREHWQGKSLGDFFHRQMQEVAKQFPEAVEKGLALDLLHFHLTKENTAGQRHFSQIKARYTRPVEEVLKLIEALKDHYLLLKNKATDEQTFPSAGKRQEERQNFYTRLAHDTLARVVLNEYLNFPRPLQQVQGILNSKMILARENREDTWLDERDFGLVMNIRLWLPRLSKGEEELLALSARRNAGSREVIEVMIRERGYYDININPQGSGIKHDYRPDDARQVVHDAATGLYWQRSGSSDSMQYAMAKEYIEELNREEFGGCRDWRLPTVEEAMSLMEPEQKQDDLYIDPVFDANQRWIWTADRPGASEAWTIYFDFGFCSIDDIGYSHSSVRAVRSP